MQTERVRICSKGLLARGFKASWFIPLVSNATVDDVLKSFAQYMATSSCDAFRPYPLLHDVFDALLQSNEDCMFVFCRRWDDKAAGILRSSRPLFSPRERALMLAIGEQVPWEMPLWTWTEKHPDLSSTMERQCYLRNIDGHCMGVWCYR